MRILHVSTRLILGGSQENTILSCEGQALRGHDVHLAFGPIYGPEGSLLQRVERFRTADGRAIATHVVPDLVRNIHPLRDWRALRQLRGLLRTLKPDIVHTHSSKAGILGRWAAWAEHAPAVVHTIHGPPFYTGQNPLAHALYVAAERFAARRCHAIVSVADAMTAQYLAQRIGRPEQYTTVRSGMEVDTFLHAAPGEDRSAARAALGMADADFVIATVARLAHQKGHDDLLDALASDLKARPAWKLLWVGDGWWRSRLIAKASALGLSVRELDRQPADAIARATATAHVLITGLVPPERVPACLRAADVLAHPSYREGLPRTVPQALLCGTPVVAYDTDGTREACLDPARVGTDQATGLLAPVGDRAALRAALMWMYDHPAERALMARRGRAWCAAAFSVPTMIDGLEAVYARALAQAGQGPDLTR